MKKGGGRSRFGLQPTTTNQGSTSQECAHHKKVKTRKFQIGDLVLKHVIESTEEKNVGKLEANWEGPYTAVVKGGKSSCTLADQDGKIHDKQ